MKPVLLFFLFTKFFVSSFSQTSILPKTKATFDVSSLNQWPSIGIPSISSDANYTFFTINAPSHSPTMVLRSINTSWKKEFASAKSIDFTADKNQAIVLCFGDSLCIVTLGSEKDIYIPSVSSYKLVSRGKDEWLCYKIKSTNDLILQNLKSGEQKHYPDIMNYLFNNDATALALQKVSKINNKAQIISWTSFPKGKSIDIWEGSNASTLAFDKSGRKLAFVATMDAEKSIWLYNSGEEKAVMIASNQSKGITNSLLIDGLNYRPLFSEDGMRLFINLKEKPAPSNPSGVMVDVWSYTDDNLQERQLKSLVGSPKYTAMLDLVSGSIIQLQYEADRTYIIMESNPDKAVINVGNFPEISWNGKSFHCSGSTVNGERKDTKLTRSESISPSGRYFVGRIRSNNSDLYSSDLTSGELKNITAKIEGKFDPEYDETPYSRQDKYLNALIWLKDESYVLIKDRYDIWMVDPTAKQSPINLTNGIGKINHIVFRFSDIYKGYNYVKPVMKGEIVLLSGFNRVTKEEGIYEIEVGKPSNPKLLTKGAYHFEIPNTPYNLNQLQIKGKKTFLIRRESATEYPNYFLTSNFKTFIPVTNVYPERNYSWLTAELHNWKGLDGRSLQGILYKPENFDSTKKYPVVFNYYENMSDKLNEYHQPSFVGNDINIPLFISRGYLIFTPDILSAPGKVGESALSSIVSAAKYLSKFPFIDSNHMGIQGHSFGSYETNYIVTHSNLFAAAMSSCGFTDLVSHYGYVADDRSTMTYYENGQMRMGKSLWENPIAYIEGSPVLSAHTVTTPLLMMANKKDPFNYSQQLELFLGLRRMGKRSWLLQYDNSGHGAWQKDAEDFTARILQFFDHYLKDSTCPKWMLSGIPAKFKGVDNGLRLIREKDTKGKWVTPLEGGVLTEEEKKKMEELKKKKPISISID